MKSYMRIVCCWAMMLSANVIKPTQGLELIRRYPCTSAMAAFAAGSSFTYGYLKLKGFLEASRQKAKDAQEKAERIRLLPQTTLTEPVVPKDPKDLTGWHELTPGAYHDNLYTQSCMIPGYLTCYYDAHHRKASVAASSQAHDFVKLDHPIQCAEFVQPNVTGCGQRAGCLTPQKVLLTNLTQGERRFYMKVPCKHELRDKGVIVEEARHQLQEMTNEFMQDAGLPTVSAFGIEESASSKETTG